MAAGVAPGHSILAPNGYKGNAPIRAPAGRIAPKLESLPGVIEVAIARHEELVGAVNLPDRF